MNILWLTNIAIPQIAKDIGMKIIPVGGWMVKLADEMAKEVKLTIVFPNSELVDGNIDGIQYYSFLTKNHGNLDINEFESRVEKVLKIVEPDVIHIHGTEYSHSYYMTEVCKKLGLQNKVVISIQGLRSYYERHYSGFLSDKIMKGQTIRDLYAGNLVRHKKMYHRTGAYEVQALQNAKHIIGRTDWDRACTYDINPNAAYYFNNEMLRRSFYSGEWDIKCCEKYSIFMSQATSPIKGLHLALEGVGILKKQYPNVHLYIAGKSFSEKPKWKLSYYEKFILNYIEDNDLKENVSFTGFLNEEEMKSRYLNSHVFLSASSIENSPNSVCEAMILGVPVVSSFVGGVVNLLKHGEEGFYFQADAPYMLAYYIRQMFENEDQSVTMAKNARKTALVRHDVAQIVCNLRSIYEGIAKL